MKKRIFFGSFLVAIAMIGTSCSNDEAVEQAGTPQEISFRTQGGTPTLRTTATLLSDVQAFAVYGGDAITATIFDGVSVVRAPLTTTGDAANFTYSPKKFYSLGATTAGFFAYSPVTATDIAVTVPINQTTGTGTNELTYKVPVPTGSGNVEQVDLLVAANLGVLTSAASVSLQFQHALARVFVTATSSSPETVTIKELKLQNLYSSGKLTVTGTTATTAALAWGTYTNKTEYPYALAATGVAVNTGAAADLVVSMDQGMMVLPQTVGVTTIGSYTDGDFKLYVKYDIPERGLTNQVVEYYINDNTYKFEPGKQYSIDINFLAGNEIKFSIEVTDFTAIDPATPIVLIP
jgi:hypothetical protein